MNTQIIRKGGAGAETGCRARAWARAVRPGDGRAARREWCAQWQAGGLHSDENVCDARHFQIRIEN